jgi:hypothetical protein
VPETTNVPNIPNGADTAGAANTANAANAAKPRHLVRYDYGMGGLLWWIHAASATEIVESLAGVEVLTDPDAVRDAESQDLKIVDLDGPLPVPLSGMRAERMEQQTMPGFGALAGRARVYLAWSSRSSSVEGGTARTLVELGPDGRVLRQVEVELGTESAVRVKEDERTSQPPFDLYDPQYAAMEIEAEEFEEVWERSN